MTRRAVIEHLDAFNSHDTSRLLRGLHPEVRWETGQEIVVGRPAAADLFDDWLWAMNPRLDLLSLVVDADLAAAECTEHLTAHGDPVQSAIAVFFTVWDGQLTRVKVFREGSANVPDKGGVVGPG
jgi:uncharacterized protein